MMRKAVDLSGASVPSTCKVAILSNTPSDIPGSNFAEFVPTFVGASGMPVHWVVHTVIFVYAALPAHRRR